MSVFRAVSFLLLKLLRAKEIQNSEKRNHHTKTAYSPVRSQKDRQDYAHQADHTGSRSTGNRIPDACLRISDKKVRRF